MPFLIWKICISTSSSTMIKTIFVIKEIRSATVLKLFHHTRNLCMAGPPSWDQQAGGHNLTRLRPS
jgi:hypothetical protein